MLEGVTSFLNPNTPNVDIWRKLHEAILRRGGLNDSGRDQLIIVWRPSHQRASIGETPEQKVADHFAKLGRLMNPDVTNMIITTKARYRAAKNWARWIGMAA